MVLYTVGGNKYFDNRLIKYLIRKSNTQAVNIIRRSFHPNDPSQGLGQFKDSFGSTLLHYAAEHGNTYLAQYFLDCNSEVDAQDNLGQSPLMLAVQGQHERVFDVLIKANANIHLSDNQGKSALQMIFELTSDHAKMLRRLFERVLLQKIIEGVTTNDLIEKLESAGFTSEAVLQWGNANAMKLMIGREGSIDAREYKDGKTMLHMAVQLGKVEIVRVLVECGADVDALDHKGRTPLSYLHDNFSRVNESSEILDMLKILVSRATRLTSCDTRGWMQIHNALLHGTNDVIEAILRSNVDLNDVDDHGNTVLHYLAQNPYADLSKCLRGRVFDANVANKNGNTPLLIATQCKSLAPMEFFLENGADANAVNAKGETPLYRALHYYSRSCKRALEILVQYGADPQGWVRGSVFQFIEMLGNCYYSRSDKAEPLIARLAIIQELGTDVTELTVYEVIVLAFGLEFFRRCQRELKRMKETSVYNLVTLFDILTGPLNRIVIHVRNGEFVSELEKMIEELKEDSPHAGLLRSRLAKATRWAGMKEKAIAAVGRILNSKNNRQYYFVADCIVDFLSFKGKCCIWCGVRTNEFIFNKVL